MTHAEAGGRINASEKVKTIQQTSEKSKMALHLWKRSAREDQNGAAINSTKGRMPIKVPAKRYKAPVRYKLATIHNIITHQIELDSVQVA